MTYNTAMNNTEKVKEQYQSADNLDIRIALHNKYSKNKMGIANWNFSIYQIEKGMRVLELGCGTAAMWVGHEDVIERCQQVVLSDFSEGMLASAKANVGERDNVVYQQIDIQQIPFEDDTFDVVIANYMLYHVPDLDKALSEVNRVLKKGGHFYANTGSENSIMGTAIKMLHMDYQYSFPFSIQNGAKKLEPYFEKVDRILYEDSLEITNVDDFVDYAYSGISFRSVCKLTKEEVSDIFQNNMVDGILHIPKEQGMFISVK